jgi:phosphoribosylformylglycinamidine cyclo-ligase
VNGSTYEQVGVKDQRDALSSVVRHLGPTLEASPARVLSRSGHYAAVLELTAEVAVAVCTDGVGSKTMIAAMVDRYDTVGFDCVAMNVNDLLCVGARPIALVDYIGVHTLDRRRADELLHGLGAAAKEAEIAVPGGEIAQLPELFGSGGDERAFDLVGTALGTVHPDRLILGDAIAPGDALVGVSSSGIHSNGLTLARRVLLGAGGLRLDREVAELGHTLGEELLEPTTIYVRAILDLWADGIETHGLAHITGDGLANLLRLNPEVGYLVDDLPPPPAVFELIRRAGAVEDAEMLRVFNMGIGFVVVVPDSQSDTAAARLVASGHRARRIGTVTGARGCVRVEPAGVTLT